MTFEQAIVQFLTDRGLWENEAAEIVRAVKAVTPAMEKRWADDVSGYPEVALRTLTLFASKEAVRWIDANAPQHFARSMFA